MPVPVPGSLRDRPFTLDQAREAGLTRDQLKGARFVRLYPRVYAPAGLLITAPLRVLAAQLAIDQPSPASYETGLALYGIGRVDPNRVHLSTRHRHPRRVPGIEVHRHNHLGPALLVSGCGVLSPERCLVDAATDLGLADVVAAGDGLIGLGHTTKDRLADFVHQHHYDGIVLARRAVELMMHGAESYRESYVRTMLVLAGLPTPEANTSYGENDFVARLDLSYSAWKVAVEYDGRQHGLSLAQREHDIRRREAMERLGWIFIVVTAAQLRSPRDIVRRVHAALASRGYKGPGPMFSAEWSRTFEPTPRYVR
jgi:hypothetical protein